MEQCDAEKGKEKNVGDLNGAIDRAPKPPKVEKSAKENKPPKVKKPEDDKQKPPKVKSDHGSFNGTSGGRVKNKSGGSSGGDSAQKQ